MSEPISHEHTVSRGRFVIARDGLEAELNYTVTPDGKWNAHHTGVPPQWRGQGIAALLVDQLVITARAQDVKVVPTCSYVVAQSDRHRDWNDVFGA